MSRTDGTGDYILNDKAFINNLLLNVGIDVNDPTKQNEPDYKALQELITNWRCKQCTFNNHPDLKECEICDSKKGGKSRKIKRIRRKRSIKKRR